MHWHVSCAVWSMKSSTWRWTDLCSNMNLRHNTLPVFSHQHFSSKLFRKELWTWTYDLCGKDSKIFQLSSYDFCLSSSASTEVCSISKSRELSDMFLAARSAPGRYKFAGVHALPSLLDIICCRSRIKNFKGDGICCGFLNHARKVPMCLPSRDRAFDISEDGFWTTTCCVAAFPVRKLSSVGERV